MRIVVTGGCGFIGLALTRQLLRQAKESDQIFLLDTMQRHGNSAEVERLLSNPQVVLIEADLTDHRIYNEIPVPVDRVYHLAAMVGVNIVEADPVGVMQTNTLSTMHLFNWFVENASPDARLLFSSSSEIYSGAAMAGFELPIPTPETVPAVISDLNHPRSSYAVTKIWGEVYANYIASSTGRFIVSVRYHNIYGPGMGYEHVIPQIVGRVLSRENPFRVIAPDQTRSFCWIDDAVQATYLVMESEKAESGLVVHIGNKQEEVKIGELYGMIFDLCDWQPEKVQQVPAPTGSVDRRCPDTDLLKNLTGYTPDTPLREGLNNTVAWYKDNLQ